MTGTVKWKFTTGGAIEASLAVVNGVVYVGSDDDNLYALDATTGALIWQFRTGGNVSSRPAVLNGAVYFGSSDNNVYALDITNGMLHWKFTTGAMVNQSGVTLSQGILFVGDRDDNLYAIDAASGNLKWKYTTNGISLEQSTPTIYNGTVYVAGWYNIQNFSQGGSLYAIDEQTGSLVWESLKGLGFSASPYIGGGLLYISADDGNFYAVDPRSGNVRWQKLIYPNGAGAMVAGDIVYVGGGGSHFLYAFNAVSGDPVWTFAVGSEGLDTSTPCVIGSDGTVYSVFDSGKNN